MTRAVLHRLAVAGFGLGIARCGLREGPTVKMTSRAHMVTCETCKAKAKSAQEAAKARPDGPHPPFCRCWGCRRRIRREVLERNRVPR